MGVVMRFCDIVVDATPRADLERTLNQARGLAERFRAHLTVVAHAWPSTSILDTLAPNPFFAQEQTRAMEDALASAHNAFKNVFGPNGRSIQWCSGIGEPGPSLHDHLLTADLLITSSSEPERCLLPDPASLALRSGAPVLRLDGQADSSRFSRVLVAWKDCSQARRAVHEALPLLARAHTVTVAGVGNEVSLERLNSVAAHLRRHRVKADALHIPHTGAGVCSELIAQARRKGADLIVTGVYSRTILAERILGGVTRDMLNSNDVSWFMAN